jgi:CRP-like cAMP-binding protein
MNSPVTPDELRALPLFSGLSDEGLERLAERAAEVECEPGQVLVVPGDPGSGMFVILEGTVSVEMRGGFHVELRQGNFFGEVALLVPGSGRVARVRAATAGRCLSVPREDFLALVESEQALALHMLRELARRLSDASADA